MSSRSAVLLDWNKPILRLYSVGDSHIGSRAAREDNLRSLAKIIHDDPCGRIIGLGDYCESIAPTDRRFDPSELMEPIIEENLSNPFYCQALRFCKIMEPTKGKWDGLVLGNHELSAISRYFVNTGAIIAERMGTRYIGGSDQSGWFIYKLKERGKTRSTFRVYAIHGWGGGELRGADALKLQRLLWKKDADVVLLAHVHRPMMFPETVESVNKAGTVVSIPRWGIITYPQVGQHGYIARKGGNECPPGYSVIEISRNHDGPPDISITMKTF